jgi:hypothetical protein
MGAGDRVLPTENARQTTAANDWLVEQELVAMACHSHQRDVELPVCLGLRQRGPGGGSLPHLTEPVASLREGQ